MKTKKCIKCDEVKDVSNFNPRKTSKDGFRNECKVCMNAYKKSKLDLEKIRILRKKYYKNKKENDPIKFEFLAEKNRNRVRNYRERGYYPNGETVKQVRQRNGRTRYEKIKKDPFKLMIMNMRSLVGLHIKNKSMTTENILGCDWETFKKHIQSKFTEGMSWDNHGRKGWHYDHIIPISSAKNEEELYKLNHYTNFQPLWASDNISKSNKILI